MLKFLLSRPIAVLMIFAALSVLGCFMGYKIPISPLPAIDIPEIIVNVDGKNMYGETLEKSAVNGLRSNLSHVPGLSSLESEIVGNQSRIRMRFEYGTNINQAYAEVNEKVDLSMGGLSGIIQRPKTVKVSTSDIPVFYISLCTKETSDAAQYQKLNELGNVVEQVIKRRLEQLDEIAFVDITGRPFPEVSIKLRNNVKSSLNLKILDIKRIIENGSMPLGEVKITEGPLEHNIHISSNDLTSIDDLKNITFKYYGRVFRLDDVADIELRQQDNQGIYLANNQPGLCLAIIKQPNAKLSDLRVKLDDLLRELRKQYPSIIFEKHQDQTELLGHSISNLKFDLIFGVFLAFMLILYFFRNLRIAFIMVITIPVSLLLSLVFFGMSGLTINIISLSGLVLGTGLIIDNSIIIIDNITQNRRMGNKLITACDAGTTEMIRPMLSSVLTTCSVFLPLIFLSGISGELFYDQAMAIVIGLGMSFIVSIVLLPVLYSLLIRSDNEDKLSVPRPGISVLEKIYLSGFKWVFANKHLCILLFFLLIASATFMFYILPKEKLPDFNQTDLIVSVDWNQEISVLENARRSKKLVNFLGNEVKTANALIGNQQFLLNKKRQLASSECELYLKINDADKRRDLRNKVADYFIKHYPTAVIRASPPPNVFELIFSEEEPDLRLALSPKDKDNMLSSMSIRKARYLLGKNSPNADIKNVSTQDIIMMVTAEEALLRYGINRSNLIEGLRTALVNQQVGVIKQGPNQIPIITGDSYIYMDRVLRDLSIPNDEGGLVPVSKLVKVERTQTNKILYGGKNGGYTPIDISTQHPTEVLEFVNTNSFFTDSIRTVVDGAYFSNRKLVNEMTMVLVVVFCLLYLILAAQFESLIQPLIVLLELPVSISGALLMLYIFNSSINLISLIGVVVMSGIIINDSILKIDAINHLRRDQNYSLMDAIHAAGKRRLKSIVMTALITIISVAPFLFGQDVGSLLQRPLSLVLVGGMIVGTIVSLYFIPLVYWYYYKGSVINANSDS